MQSLPFVDPVDHRPLRSQEDGFVSESGKTYPLKGGVPHFLSDPLQAEAGDRTGLMNAIKTFLRSFPRLYLFLIHVISPVLFTGYSPKTFLKRFREGDIVLNVGSGVHKYVPWLINVDIFYYKGVDVVADARMLPFADGSVDGIVCEFLLEHVREPQKIVDEMLRVLKKDGSAYICVPFVYPFHASPNDFQRWSKPGLEELCKGGTIERIGPRSGPTSALVAQLVTWTAIALSFGSHTLYTLWSTVLLIVFFPLKILDLLFAFYPTAIHGAASWYVIVKKP